MPKRYILKEVVSKAEEEEFLAIPDQIYKEDKNWVKPLNSEIKAVFNAEQNVFFKNGIAKRWILESDSGEVGRVAAFINFFDKTKERETKGGMGFFECSPNQEAAFVLFDSCKKWFKEHDVYYFEGPINFGENDNNWGLLVEGFSTPAYGMSYNPNYYQQFFEDYGFKLLYEQYTNHFNLLKPFPERFKKISERVLANEKYQFKSFKKAERESFLKDMQAVYNLAWQDHHYFRPIDYEYLLKSFDKMKSFLEEELIWFAYSDNKPIGFIVSIPDINQILKHLNGEMGLLNKLRFWYYLLIGEIDRFRVLVMGIVPEFQNRGIESGLIYHAFNAAKKMDQYHEAELSWVGSFNSKMMALHKASGAEFGKKYITYSYQSK